MDSLEAQQTVIPEVPKTKRTSKKQKQVKEDVFLKHDDDVVIDTDTIKVADIEKQPQPKTKTKTQKKKAESSGESQEDVFKECVLEILKDAAKVVGQLNNLLRNKQVRPKRV